MPAHHITESPCPEVRNRGGTLPRTQAATGAQKGSDVEAELGGESRKQEEGEPEKRHISTMNC